jgi:hypothetical protein
MNRNTTLILFLIGLISVGVAAYYYMTEETEIPDITWNQPYNLYSDQPDAHKVFYQMLKKYYGDKNVEISNEIPYTESGDTTKQLIIFLGDIAIDSLSDESYQITEFMEMGHQVLSIGSSLSFTNAYYSFYVDSENKKYNCSEEDIQLYTLVPENYVFRFSLSPYTRDTSVYLPFSKGYFTSQMYSEKSLIQTNTGVTCFRHITPVLPEPEYLPYTANHYFHTSPILFSNIAALQPWYVKHFNFVFSHFHNKKVILIPDKDLKNAERSPLEILFKNRGLKYAYYGLLATLFLYLYFEGKKIIRPLPVILPKENLSASHIKTLARLHEVHGNNYFLVRKMKENFLVKISQLFQIFPHETDMTEVLVKKSGLEKPLIEKIFILFDQIEKNGKCSDQTLMELHSHLHIFYHKLNTI